MQIGTFILHKGIRKNIALFGVIKTEYGPEASQRPIFGLKVFETLLNDLELPNQS